jgi:hypothetical protein
MALRSSSASIALPLLISVIIEAFGLSDIALAAGRGGGGFHMGGGGGFHTGRAEFGMGGGGFHPSGGFRFGAGAFYPGGVGMHSFATRGVVGRGFAGQPWFGHTVRGFAGREYYPAHNLSGAHNTIAAHNQFNPASRFNSRGQFDRSPFGSIQAERALSSYNQFNHNLLAHYQFVAQNFRGLYDFNRGGFNRNVFGNPNQWNNWGGRFWGPGWHRWGNGWGGWAGPVFWPFLYGDLFTFALWPYDYYDPFWFYGPDFLLTSIFAPGPYLGGDYGYAPDYGSSGDGYAPPGNVYYGGSSTSSGTTQEDRQVLSEINAAAEESCGSLAPGITDFPIARLRNIIEPTGAQLTALDDLGTAAAIANNTIKASCPTAVPLTPLARLDAAEARLESIIQAVDVVREPLERFYDLLSDEQKQRFESMGSGKNEQTQAGGYIAALCTHQSGDVSNLPIERIAQVVGPSGKQQEAALAALQQSSRDAAEQLQVSCPSQMPQTPAARLDAAKTRLQAMVTVINAARPKLQAFYDSLSDDQKARFNIMSPSPSAVGERQTGYR